MQESVEYDSSLQGVDMHVHVTSSFRGRWSDLNYRREFRSHSLAFFKFEHNIRGN